MAIKIKINEFSVSLKKKSTEIHHKITLKNSSTHAFNIHRVPIEIFLFPALYVGPPSLFVGPGK